ncbi:MAG TPA: 2-oxoacid:ferredoxin oxidoreductase subunit beta [Thiolapillus brandeum]|uniref:2-oxoacid:ferredoxin oxidoreductase subunit beta n=1 Tax=Thiolapillus brandeum TaxID=1076588 RepID=A0A831NWC5_9GAMM|nr:2-oxoacid:ferredoxin oxidoreductase subunit beta [Thiolapillus brandeum]
MAAKHSFINKGYEAGYPVDWCPGCGNFGIQRALESALAVLELPPHRVAVFGGIGCSGKTSYNLDVYGIHTLHGRLLPFASGAKLANPELTVIAAGGDGDGLGIGAGHFVNSGRRNLDITYILFNNGVYGLTKGQPSPTLGLGEQTKSMHQKNLQASVNPLMLAAAAGYTWIGRGYAYDKHQLEELMVQAIEHPGLSYLDVLQPCPRYNDVQTRDWYAGKDLDPPGSRLYSLQEEGYDPLIPEDAGEDQIKAGITGCIEEAFKWGDRIPTGVFLRNLAQPRYLDLVAEQIPTYLSSSPANNPIADAEGRSLTDLHGILSKLTVGY